MNSILQRSVNSGIRIALLTVCTAAIGAAPATLLAQAPDTPPPTQQAPPPDGPPPGGMHRGGPGGPGMEQRQLDMMTRHLKLTPDQVSQIKAIDDDTRQQMMALHDDTSTPREQKRPKMESIHQAQDAKIKAVLTPDQKTQYEAMQAKMRQRREERREDGAGGPPPPPPSAPQL